MIKLHNDLMKFRSYSLFRSKSNKERKQETKGNLEIKGNRLIHWTADKRDYITEEEKRNS